MPGLLRIEVLPVLRRQHRSGRLDAGQVAAAVDDPLEPALVVYPTGPLLRPTWELRGSVTAHDACYVALADSLGCPLLTVDSSALSRATGPTCNIEFVGG